MYNIKLPIPMISYTESPQANPIRWLIVLEKGTELLPQTAFFKCKDYFSDVLYKRKHNFTFKVYGFSNDFPTNPDFVGVVVKGLCSKFVNNLKNLNLPNLEVHEDVEPIAANEKYVYLKIGSKWFNYACDISLLTLIIRICNENRDINHMGDVFISNDQALYNSSTLKSVLKQKGFDFITKDQKEDYENKLVSTDYKGYKETTALHDSGYVTFYSHFGGKFA